MVVEILQQNPELVVVLAVVMRALLAWQRGLLWSEYRVYHRLKRMAFPLLDQRLWDGLVNEKGGRDDAEFIATMPAVPTSPGTLTETVRALCAAGGDLHLLCSIKRRPAGHGDRYSAAHVVFLHGDGTQTEAFLFRNDDLTVDVFAHHEPDPSQPLPHLGGDEQSDGDVRGVVTDALGL